MKKPFAILERKIHRLSFITINLSRHNTHNNAFFKNHYVPNKTEKSFTSFYYVYKAPTENKKQSEPTPNHIYLYILLYFLVLTNFNVDGINKISIS